MMNLEEKSQELKNLVAEYENAIFLGNISLMMQLITSPDGLSSLSGLTSPQRQLYYVSALNLTSDPSKTKKGAFTDEEWDKIKELLTEIENGYNDLFYPKSEEEVDEVWQDKRRIAMPSFLGYFNLGHLNYEEQVIERVSQYFTPFNNAIKAHFGISVDEFINIYNCIDSLPNKFLNENINHKDGDESWQDFTSRMMQSGITPEKWVNHMPRNLKNLLEFIQDGGKMHRFSFKYLEDQFGTEKTNAFLSNLTSVRSETSFLYFTERNPLYEKPLFKVNSDEYQIIETKQLIHAIYNLLADFCINDSVLNEKFYAKRGDKLEEKIISIFNKYFHNKATIYQGFYTDFGNEQDILILINGTAFIIEAKSSKRKEPKRDPDKAYDLILNNFEETIQKGYDQSYRVKEFFIDQKPLKIYSDQGLTQLIAEINTKKYYNVFSIIVTLEKFGLIQIDLNELLQIYDDDDFPWSLCIDDLEVFLLALVKGKKTQADFVHFLRIREKLHSHIFCSDEMEICGAFLKGMLTKLISEKEEILFLHPEVADLFDKYYFKGGLGFDNEKNMHIKTDDKYFSIGFDSIHNNKAKKR